jgi:uncharacterized protein
MGALWVLSACAVTGTFALADSTIDCTSQLSKAEKLVCSDTGLIAVDSVVATAYKQALAVSANADFQRQIQLSWQQNVRDSCQDLACLRKVYDDRLSDLDLRGHCQGKGIGGRL